MVIMKATAILMTGISSCFMLYGIFDSITSRNNRTTGAIVTMLSIIFIKVSIDFINFI